MIGQAKRIAELTNLRAKSSAAGGSAKKYLFLSGKGGTGKTFICANMAIALAESGKKVLLVDADINFANLHAVFNLSPKNNILQIISGKNNFESCVERIDKNLFALFGDSGGRKMSDYSKNDINLFLAQLDMFSSQFDIVLFDAASGAGVMVEQLIKKIKDIIIVANTEPTSIMDSYVMVKLLHQLNEKAVPKVIINKYIDQISGETAFQNLQKASEHFLRKEIEFIGMIQFNNIVMQSIIEQKPLMKLSGGEEVKSNIISITQRLLKSMQLVNIKH